MIQRPQSVPHTKRQTIHNAAGQAIERAYLYLLPSTWTVLKALCIASGKPSSEFIELLILTAASGNSYKGINDRISTGNKNHPNNSFTQRRS